MKEFIPIPFDVIDVSWHAMLQNAVKRLDTDPTEANLNLINHIREKILANEPEPKSQ